MTDQETIARLQPFTRAARVQTMLRDINELRQACRAEGTPAIQDALDNCERWFGQLDPTSANEGPFTRGAA